MHFAHRYLINECLVATDQGIYIWTSFAHRDLHKFYPLKDNALWEWGF